MVPCFHCCISVCLSPPFPRRRRRRRSLFWHFPLPPVSPHAINPLTPVFSFGTPSHPLRGAPGGHSRSAVIFRTISPEGAAYPTHFFSYLGGEKAVDAFPHKGNLVTCFPARARRTDRRTVQLLSFSGRDVGGGPFFCECNVPCEGWGEATTANDHRG